MGRSAPLSGSQTTTQPSPPPAAPDLDTLRAIERRVLWLSAAIVHHANRVRENRSGVKVGGHQASSASMVSLMTALWFSELRAEDRPLAPAVSLDRFEVEHRRRGHVFGQSRSPMFCARISLRCSSVSSS